IAKRNNRRRSRLNDGAHRIGGNEVGDAGRSEELQVGAIDDLNRRTVGGMDGEDNRTEDQRRAGEPDLLRHCQPSVCHASGEVIAANRKWDCAPGHGPLGACAVASASWTAAVLCRFGFVVAPHKAPEDWRTPKPGGPPTAQLVASTSWTAAVLCRF